jgi:luciferase family oxidoreductase group 1
VSGAPDLAVVDPSPTRRGGTAAEALRETVALARVAERLGYRRYWVTEHHGANSFAGTSPEVLIGQIAAATRSIRVGSGGVLLGNTSSLRVAEQFAILAAFFPGRLDLGLGRGAGADEPAATAVAHPRPRLTGEEFPAQVSDLLGFLTGGWSPDHPFARVKAQPGPANEAAPEVWILGSSAASARFAAAQGLPYAFAEFLCMTGEGPEAAAAYHREFSPSRFLAAPRLNVTVEVVCAPASGEARRLAASRDLDRIADVYGLEGLLPPDEALAFPARPGDRRFAASTTRAAIDGDPVAVGERIRALAAAYGAAEVGIMTSCYAFEDRVRSYELVAAALDLASQSSTAAERSPAAEAPGDVSPPIQ